MYFILGIAFTLIQVVITLKLTKIGKEKLWFNCILTLVPNALVIFAIAWAYASVIEHEPQAAFVGLLVFGGTGLIFAIIAYRLINKKQVIKAK